MIRDLAEPLLGEILGLTAAELDVPEHVDRAMSLEYDRLTTWLGNECHDRYRAASAIYPQGSRRLGTMVQPAVPDLDYDVDMVLERDVKRASTTQQGLKDSAGELLSDFVGSVPRAERPSLDEGGRCWTLSYPGGFHMDILPALPNDDPYSAPGSIIITDRDVRAWQVSDPKGFARWFDSRQSVVLHDEREKIAKSRGVTIEEIPERSVPTPLRRDVQLLKRHRDLYFADDCASRPASVIVTTLAAQAYLGERDSYSGIRSISERMGSFVERRDGKLWIPNPVRPEENFADRWAAHPERADAFFTWLGALRRDVTALGGEVRLDHVLKAIGSTFGQDVARRAGLRFGTAVRESREAGQLRARPDTGQLGRAGTVVRPHTFFGGSRKRKR